MSEPILSATAAIAALAGEDNQLRYYAAWWLGKHQVQSACQALCDALQDERYRLEQGGYPLRRQAARSLGQLKNPQAVPALIAALGTEDLRLQEAVIQALANIRDSRAVEPLLNLLKSSQEKPLEVLIEALGTLQVWSACSWIKPFLDHPSERVQCAAARYLYLLTKQPQYIERILKNLSHENMYLRWAAVFDLGAISYSQEVVQAIVAAKVPNSLKLLNLKRILDSALDNNTQDKPTQETLQLLFSTVDELLIQL
ncbi:HEAT repeat domain-containing protein [Chroococcidiopsis sp. TS-821]|uniref:HEAT repeat domain-containing protein n=1 Tax=Chroococcidiopsis sp. TS-821 TaxID=1378066 RepID=UPI000CEF56F3|nr:HEAT repeat domain-containing protein [Chroococcidiopsis sp. TS-821]PPS43218.1 glycosyl transferase family 2 [Chroococcidiopsis sp. TS-821]